MLNCMSRPALAAALCLFFALPSANSSTWSYNKLGRFTIIVPQPELEQLGVDTFQYGSTSTLFVGDLNDTTQIYYQTRDWVGDGSSGSYGAYGAWQCVEASTINSGQWQLGLSADRWQINAVAVMGESACSIAKFNAGELLQSAPLTSNEFMQLSGRVLANDGVTTYLKQNPAVDQWGSKTSYDLHLRWPAVDGVESYKLTLFKDNIPYVFTLSASEYNQALTGAGFWTIADTYTDSNETFSAYTGAGEYRFDVQYCWGGQCSTGVDYNTPIKVEPLMPTRFWADSNASNEGVPQGMVKFVWRVDRRSKAFTIFEQFNRSGVTAELPLDFPNNNTYFTLDTNDYRYAIYTTSLPRAVAGNYVYQIQSCASNISCTRLTQTAPRQGSTPGTSITIPEGPPVGMIDNYVAGSNKLTGFARDKVSTATASRMAGGVMMSASGVTDQTEVILYANGFMVPYSPTSNAVLANQFNAATQTNHGFEYDNIKGRLAALPGIDITKPISLKLTARDKHSDGTVSNFMPVFDTNLPGLGESEPIAANDSFSFPLGETPLLNLIHNDKDLTGKDALIPVFESMETQHGTLTVESNISVKYTPKQTTTGFTDTFTYKVQDSNGNFSNEATVTLTFASLVANDDVVYVNWAAPKSTARTTSIDVFSNDSGMTLDGVMAKVTSPLKTGSVTTSSGGYLVPDVSGKINYTLAANTTPAPVDCFTYRLEATGTNKTSGEASVCIKQKSNPVADSYGIAPGKITTLDVTANDIPGSVAATDLKPRVLWQSDGVSSVVKNVDEYWQVLFDPLFHVAGDEVSFTYHLVDDKSGQVVSDSAATVTLTLGELPSKPQTPRIDRRHVDKATLKWDPITSGQNYHLQQFYSEGLVDITKQLRGWVTVFTPSYTSSTVVGNLKDGHYYFRLSTCKNNTILCSDWVLSEKLTVSTPARPTITRGTERGSYTVGWQDIANTVDYTLQEGTCATKACTNPTWEDMEKTTQLSMPFSGKKSGIYAYRVTACQAHFCSAYSPITRFKVDDREVTFVHSDLLGSPAVSTDEFGEEL